MKKNICIRASDLTRKQFDELQQFFGMSKTEILAIAINNFYVDYFLVKDVFDKVRKQHLKTHLENEGFSDEEMRMIEGRVASLKDTSVFNVLLSSNRDTIMTLLKYKQL